MRWVWVWVWALEWLRQLVARGQWEGYVVVRHLAVMAVVGAGEGGGWRIVIGMSIGSRMGVLVRLCECCVNDTEMVVVLKSTYDRLRC